MKPETDLTTTERVRLEQYEKIIERGKETFIEVGSALMSIRESRLYRATHDTFEAYCRERWGWSKTHVNRQIQAAEIADHLTPTGVKPGNERQARPLAGLEPEQRAEAWDEAVRIAPDGKVTEKHVRTVVDRRRREAEPDQKAEPAQEEAEPEAEEQDAVVEAEGPWPEIDPDSAVGVLKNYVDTMLQQVGGVSAQHMVINEMIKYLRGLSIGLNQKAGVA